MRLASLQPDGGKRKPARRECATGQLEVADRWMLLLTIRFRHFRTSFACRSARGIAGRFSGARQNRSYPRAAKPEELATLANTNERTRSIAA